MFVPALALAFCAGLAPQAIAAVDVPDDFVNEVVVGGLDQPAGMARLPDGRILVVEQRTGAIRVVFPDSGVVSPPVFVVPDLNILTGERGLLGIAIDPRWPAQSYVYLMYTRVGNVIRLVRYNLWGDLLDAGSDSLEFVQPLYLFDDLPDAFGNHNAGRLRFGLDGTLYASLGDDQDMCAAADSSVMKGQLLRLEVRTLPAIGTGQVADPADMVPQGNPFPNSGPVASLTYAYGMRNPWNFQIDPVLGKMYLADVGEAHFEEINEVEPGDFLGWPWREGYRVFQVGACPEPGGSGANSYKGPIVVEPHGTSRTAIFMGILYRAQVGGNANWPAEYQDYYGSLFYGEYYSGWLRRFRKQGGVWHPAAAVPGQPNATDWGTGFHAAVDFMMDDDGSVLWLGQFDDTFGPVTGHLSRVRYAAVADVGRADPSARTLRAAPNPFRAGTHLSFALPAEADVRLEIFDVSGRRLRTLAAGRMAAGAHRSIWDGRNDAGATVAPGVYLARLVRAERSETLRVMRLR
jgi:glucose/arabinose dehydrogenase